MLSAQTMRKPILKIALIATLFLTSFILTSAAKAENPLCPDPIRVAWNPYPPYAFVHQRNGLDGLDISILKTVLTDMGCDFTFRNMTPKRAFARMEQGSIDVTPAASITGERKKFAHFSDAYRGEIMTVFGNRENRKLFDLEKKEDLLSGRYSILLVNGAWYGPYLKVLQKQKTEYPFLIYLSDAEKRFQMLSKKRADLTIADSLAGSWTIKEEGLEHLVQPFPITLNDDVVHFMFAKASVKPEFVQAFNKALKRFNDNTHLRSQVFSRFVPREVYALYDLQE